MSDNFTLTKEYVQGAGGSELLGHSSVSTASTYYVRDTFGDDELFNGEAL